MTRIFSPFFFFQRPGRIILEIAHVLLDCKTAFWVWKLGSALFLSKPLGNVVGAPAFWMSALDSEPWFQVLHFFSIKWRCAYELQKSRGFYSKARWRRHMVAMLQRTPAKLTQVYWVTVGDFLWWVHEEEELVAKGQTMGTFLFWLIDLDYVSLCLLHTFDSNYMHAQSCVGVRG